MAERRRINVVATKRTRVVAAMMVDTAKETGSAADAILAHIHRVPPGQAAALLRVILAELVSEGGSVPRPVAETRTIRTTVMVARTEAEEQSLVDEIVAQATRVTGTSAEDILGQSKLSPHALARHLVQYALRESGVTAVTTARLTGGRDHSSVTYAHRRVGGDEYLKALADDMLGSVRRRECEDEEGAA